MKHNVNVRRRTGNEQSKCQQPRKLAIITYRK